MRLIRAKNEARKILTLFVKNDEKIDPFKIAKKLGINVYQEVMENDISGILVQKNNKYSIFINSTHPETRKRFTMAHEIGHYILNPSEELHIDNFVSYNFRNSKSTEGIDEKEIEANQFAAELILPENRLINFMRKYSQKCVYEDFIKDMSSYFEVSQQALTIRLAVLNLV